MAQRYYVYDAKVSIRSKLHLLQTNQAKLSWNRDRLEVCHELHVRTEVRSFVHKVEVHTEAVDQEDLLESIQQVTKKLRTGPSDVDYNDNQYDNIPVGGLNHKSVDGVSQCMNVDRLDKSMKGVSHCTSVHHISQTMKEVDESVAIDDLIRLRSQDVDHNFKESIVVDDNDFKDKDNEEAFFLTTQQVRDLAEEIFGDTPSGSDSTHSTEVKCKKRRRELKLNKSKRVIKTIVDFDGNEIQLLSWTDDLTSSLNAPKRTVTCMNLLCHYFVIKIRWNLGGIFHGVKTVMLFNCISGRNYSAGATLKEVGYLAITFSFGLTICGDLGSPMMTEQWQVHISVYAFLIPLYLDNAEFFDKKNIDKASYPISFRYANGVPLQAGL
nr:hypothetical protein [Tanacetum cinerariifolium]